MARSSESFDEFYAASVPRLTQQLFLATGDLTRAQDCSQEAFLRAWRSWDRIGTDVEDPYAWVRAVAWRLAVSDWRRATAQFRALVRHGPPRVVAPPSADEMAVRDALARLPLEQRAVVVLHYFADLRTQDISRVLAIPEGTVKARLVAARKALERLLDDSVEGSPWTSRS